MERLLGLGLYDEVELRLRDLFLDLFLRDLRVRLSSEDELELEESDSEEHVDDVMTNEMSYQEINDDIIEEIVNTKPKEPCANCGSEDIKNLCDKCEKQAGAELCQAQVKLG